MSVRYECTLKRSPFERCPFEDSTSVIHCVFFLPDGTEVLCQYCRKVISEVTYTIVR